MKIRYFRSALIFVWPVIFLMACDTDNKRIKESSTEEFVSSEGKILPREVKLFCVSKAPDEYDNPKSAVFLSINGKEQEIAEIYACSDIQKSEYEKHEIPPEAIMACGGWWAGAGDYFYIIDIAGEIKVFQGWQDSQQEDEGFHWEEIKLKK